MELVAVLQINLVQPGVGTVQVVEIEHVLTAVTLEHQAGQIRRIGIDTGLTNSLHDGHRSGSHFDFASRIECPGEHDALATETQQADVDLRAVDVIGQPFGNIGAKLLDGFACCFDVPDVGVEQGAVRTNQATVSIKLLLRARRSGQFRMVPDGDVEKVVGADAVSLGLEAQ